MSARRSALVGAALTLAAAVATPARAGAPQPLPTQALPSATSVLPSPQLRAQVTPAGPVAPPKRTGTLGGPAPAASVPGADEVDDELLEFLGSVGDDKDDGRDWLDFLASTDVDKLAKRAAKTPARGK